MIYLGADHAGFELKEEVKKYLDDKGSQYEDLGSTSLDPKDDYPDFALLVAQKVAETGEKGILICGTGIGVMITANKVKGIRAAFCCDQFMAEQSRLHNDSNILCLGGRVHSSDNAKLIVEAWLATEYEDAARHQRRIEKINQIEEKHGTPGHTCDHC